MFKRLLRFYSPSVMGWDDALILGAISAGTTAYASHQANSANQGINAMNAQQALDFFQASMVEQRDYNTQGRDFAREQTYRNQDFQERMANTAVQRAVGDMNAAGINPMMSVMKGTGAAVPSGAAPVSSSGSAPTGSVPSKIAMQRMDTVNAVDALRTKMEFDRQDAITDNIKADTAEKASRVPQSMMAAQKMEAEITNLVEMRPKIAAEIANIKSDTFRKDVQAEVDAAYQRLLVTQEMHEAGKIDLTAVQKAKANAETVLLKYAQPEAKSSAELWQGLDNKDGGAVAKGLRWGVELLKGLRK